MELIAQGVNKASYRDGDRRIKIFESTFKKSDILNEALNQARVEETGLRIPKLLEVTVRDGKWCIVTEYIEGETLQELMDKNPDKTDEYLEQFVLLQKEILSKRAPMLNRMKEKFNRKISQSGLDATARYEMHVRLDAMKNHVKVCHGDFNPSNVIVDKEGNMYVIDWSHATQGNGSADAARTYLLFMLDDKPDLAEKYLDLYCKVNDVAKQYVFAWTPIVAASQLVKGKPEERDFLLRWTDVVDYD